ncbi:MAG: hypothetical protein QGI08_05730 [Paracoccaceae bacterium]|jgi:hypothetical protein|nr:hypothetical protein [Paracoccaceae bacterium]MDP7185203.1 hypothetical protein [Paracoccaceae bacterium]
MKTTLERILVEYFEGKGPFCGLGFDRSKFLWKIPARREFEVDLCGDAAKDNVTLRYAFETYWKDNPHRHYELARWVVKEWGKIPRLSETNIHSFTKRAETPRNFTPIDNIASYSKVLSFVFPDRYAIFDARVSASLNAIQLLSQTEGDRMWFPRLPSRNAGIKDFNSSLPDFKGKFQNRSQNSGSEILPDFAYEEYVHHLRYVKMHVQESRELTWYEMALFSDAPKLVELASIRFRS